MILFHDQHFTKISILTADSITISTIVLVIKSIRGRGSATSGPFHQKMKEP